MRAPTAPTDSGCPRLPAPLRSPARPSAVARALAPATAPHWLDRLAAWADRQPTHHRLGCWTVG